MTALRGDCLQSAEKNGASQFFEKCLYHSTSLDDMEKTGSGLNSIPIQRGIQYLDLDLWHEVIAQIYASQSFQIDLLSLMLTCRTVYDFTVPFFYRHIRISTRRQAHGCFNTLISKERVASFVQKLHILSDPSLYIEDEGEFDRLPLIPLLTGALLRTTRLKILVFNTLVWTKESDSLDALYWSNETKQLFLSLSQCTFSLQTFIMLLPIPDIFPASWEHIIPFLNKQSQLRHIGLFKPPPQHLVKTLTLPRLETILLHSNLVHERDTQAFFSHFSQIPDVTVTFIRATEPQWRTIQSLLEGVLQYASQLTSLTITFLERHYPDPLLLHTNVRSKTLHHLTVMTPWRGPRGSPDLVLSDINTISQEILSNLKSIFFEYIFPSAFDFSTWIQDVNWCPKMKGINFYFDTGDGRAKIVTRDIEDEQWNIAEVTWEEIPRVHTLASERAQRLVPLGHP